VSFELPAITQPDPSEFLKYDSPFDHALPNKKHPAPGVVSVLVLPRPYTWTNLGVL